MAEGVPERTARERGLLHLSSPRASRTDFPRSNFTITSGHCYLPYLARWHQPNSNYRLSSAWRLTRWSRLSLRRSSSWSLYPHHSVPKESPLQTLFRSPYEWANVNGFGRYAVALLIFSSKVPDSYLQFSRDHQRRDATAVEAVCDKDVRQIAKLTIRTCTDPCQFQVLVKGAQA